MLCLFMSLFFFFNDTATTEIYTLSLHDALPISLRSRPLDGRDPVERRRAAGRRFAAARGGALGRRCDCAAPAAARRGDTHRVAALWPARRRGLRGRARRADAVHGAPDRGRPVRFSSARPVNRDARALAAVPSWVWL